MTVGHEEAQVLGDGAVVVAVLVTAVAFGAGLVTGWLWWGRRFFVGRLTRADAEALAEARLETERRAAGG